MRGNERADALVGKATTESSLTLDPATMLSLVCENFEAVRVDTSNTTLSLKEVLEETVLCQGLPASFLISSSQVPSPSRT